MGQRIIIISIFMLSIGIASLNAQVSISDDPNYITDPSAVLDLSSNDWGGFVPPCLTTAERSAIINPIAGLMVFDTDSLAFFLFTGLDWLVIEGNTLDKAYDQGPNPGDGRNIDAYNGPVEIHSDSMALYIVDDTLIYTQRDLVHVLKISPGNGLFVHHDHNGNAIEARNSHSGSGIYGINSGLGPAATFETTTNLNTEPAVVIISKGSSNGLNVSHEDDEGSAGFFENINVNSIDPTLVVNHGGISHGIEVKHNGLNGQAASFDLIDPNNLDQALTVNNLGKGNAFEVTHIGLSGRAGSFDLIDPNNLDQALTVNNLGKGNAFEVTHLGLIGRAGSFVLLDPNNTGPAVEVNNLGQGEGLVSEAIDSNGVVGAALSMIPQHAGVKAKGNGVAGPGLPKAAALDIHNGAIRVTGVNKPAGKDSFNLIANPVYSCPRELNVFCDVTCDGQPCEAFCAISPNPHDHEIGASTVDFVIVNDLVIPGSFIQISLEGSNEPAFAQITAVNAGSFTVKITALGCVDGPLIGFIHYFIVNP